MEAPGVGTVIVGVDGTEASLRAAEYAVAVADRYDAELIALHVVDGAEYRALASGEIDAEEVSAEGRSFLAEVERLASAADVRMRKASALGFSAHRKLIHPGSVVLDAAEEFGADFVVLPRAPIDERPPGEGTLTKAAEYALQYASQPILAV